MSVNFPDPTPQHNDRRMLKTDADTCCLVKNNGLSLGMETWNIVHILGQEFWIIHFHLYSQKKK